MPPQTAVNAGFAEGTGSVTTGDWVSRILFLATFLYFWISIDPYVDLGSPASLLPREGSNLANQIVISLLTIGVLWRAATLDLGVAKVLFSWILVLLFAWFAVAAVTSMDPSLSARRYVLTIMVMATAAGVLMLPRDTADFSAMIAIVAIVVLVLSYGGVLLAPQYSVHQATDLLEPQHAGDWRGPFNHKNAAGSAMVLNVFMGLFVARARNRALGWGIVAASVLFLAFSLAKTSIQMIAPILLLAWLVTLVRSFAARAVLIWGGLAVVSLFTVGSVIFAPIGDLLSHVMSDPTFTNRTDIWTFVLSKVTERLWIGQGYDAFWGSNAVVFGEAQSWANTATDSHNCYLELLLTTGVPGLILAILFVVVLPTIDFHRSMESSNDRATTLFFLRTWLFCIYFGTMECFMFKNGGAVWFMMLIAILGLRLNARATQVVP